MVREVDCRKYKKIELTNQGKIDLEEKYCILKQKVKFHSNAHSKNYQGMTLVIPLYLSFLLYAIYRVVVCISLDLENK